MKENKSAGKMVVVLSWTAVVLWMTVIYYFSSQPGGMSSQVSLGVTEMLFRAVAYVFRLSVEAVGGYVGRYHLLMRKVAHGGLYFVLALLVLSALVRSRVTGRKLYLVAFLFCVLYAVSDEVHQLFVPGRGGQVLDVVIDSAGAFVGGSVWVLGRWGRMSGQDVGK